MVSTGSYIVNASVDSSDVSQVKVGDQATITVSGSTTPIYGTVGSVGLLATTTSGVSSFPVVIDVTGSPSGVYGGSSVTVSIITEELQDVVVVPTTAISYAGNNTEVTVDSAGKRVTRAVQIGAASNGETQVTSGLSVGDKIYVTTVSFHGATGTGHGRVAVSSVEAGSGAVPVGDSVEPGPAAGASVEPGPAAEASEGRAGAEASEDDRWGTGRPWEVGRPYRHGRGLGGSDRGATGGEAAGHRHPGRLEDLSDGIAGGRGASAASPSRSTTVSTSPSWAPRARENRH